MGETTTLLDGAMGTALLDRGLPPGAPPEAWLLDRPEAIRDVHAGHAAAGAEVVLTCTFGLAAPRLAGAGVRAPVTELAARAVSLARAGAPGARVAGDLGPTGLCGPGVPPPEPSALEARFGAAAGALAAAGADLIWLESFWDVAEARAALSAARRTGLPVAVTFTLVPGPRGLEAPDGTPGLAALAAAAGGGAAIAGVNCVAADGALVRLVADAARALAIPVAVKPSPGLPGEVAAPDVFARGVARAVAAGARWVGGCCGAGPDHLRAVARAIAPGATGG